MRITAQQVDEATAIRRATTSLAARARVERRGDLTLNQVAALGRILVRGPVTPGELADQLATLPQSLTRTVQALEARGLIRRTPDPTDGRGSLLAATPAGRRAMRDEMAPRDRWVAQAMAAVCTPEERQTLVAAAGILHRLVEHGGGVAPVEP